MKRFRSVLLASLVSLSAGAAATLVSHDAQASVSIAILFDELVQDSSAAAVVTPMEARTVWENGRIITYTRVHVDTKVAGALDDEAWVRTLGGVVGDVGQSVSGEAVLTVGRPTLLFLVAPGTGAQSVYAVTARAQGQFPVTLDASKQVRVLMRAHGVGDLVAPPSERVARATLRMRTVANVPGLAGKGPAPLAAEVLHGRPVDEATQTIAAAWARLHAP